MKLDCSNGWVKSICLHIEQITTEGHSFFFGVKAVFFLSSDSLSPPRLWTVSSVKARRRGGLGRTGVVCRALHPCQGSDPRTCVRGPWPLTAQQTGLERSERRPGTNKKPQCNSGFGVAHLPNVVLSPHCPIQPWPFLTYE